MNAKGGRPPKPDTERLYPVQTFLPAEMMVALHTIARRRAGTAISALVREMIAVGLERAKVRESRMEALEALKPWEGK